MVSSSLACKYWTRAEVNGSYKHSSLLRCGNNYRCKKVYSAGNMVIIKLMEKLTQRLGLGYLRSCRICKLPAANGLAYFCTFSITAGKKVFDIDER
jgi:hypothetical protein